MLQRVRFLRAGADRDRQSTDVPVLPAHARLKQERLAVGQQLQEPRILDVESSGQDGYGIGDQHLQVKFGKCLRPETRKSLRTGLHSYGVQSENALETLCRATLLAPGVFKSPSEPIHAMA